MKIPHPREKLPELMTFIDELDAMTKSGQLSDWDSGFETIMQFYTPEQLAKIETVIPHWQQMTTFGNGITCVHVTLVVLSTLQLPEYQAANPEEQCLMLWASLFHDVEKILIPKEKDHVHGFRSAVTAAHALPVIGFETKAPYLNDFESWVDLTWNAVCNVEQAMAHSPIRQAFMSYEHEVGVRETQDNRKLPAILAGIDSIFEQPAALIVKSVLLHMSLDAVTDYPHTAALSDDEIRAYISPELHPFLKVMHLADCDGWSYFDAELRGDWRKQILAKFTQIRSLYRE
jgi:hypothetical protein